MTSHPATPSPVQSKIKSTPWRRRAAWVLAMVLATWLLGWLAVPPILRSQAEKQLAQVLGRQVRLQEVAFKPWSLELELRGLSVARQDGSSPQLEIRRIYVDAELQSLMRLAPVIDAVTIDEPKVYLKHEGAGRYDIDDILDKLARPEEPAGPLPRFAVFNIAINHGSFEFVDAPVNAAHKVEQLQLQVPFLSSLASRRDVVTQPHLSFVLNGDRFDTTASTTPFASTRHTEASIQLPGLDLAPYLPYWPAKWPVRPSQAELQLGLTVTFEQHDTPKVVVKGKAALSHLVLNERIGDEERPLLSLSGLSVDVAHAEPLAGTLELSSVALERPQVWLGRDGQGRLNLERLARAWTPDKTSASASGTSAPAANWQISLAQMAVEDGVLHWRDASTAPAASVTLEDIRLQLSGATWPVQKPVPFEGSTRVAGSLIEWKGEATQTSAKSSLAFDALPLSLARPYLAGLIKPALDGSLTARLDLSWNAAGEPDAGLALNATQLELRGFALRQGRQDLAGLDSLRLENTSVHSGKQTVSISRVTADGPQANVSRQSNGQWMFQDWLHTPPVETSSAAPAAPTPQATWDVAVQSLSVNRGRITFRDDTPGQPVRLTVQDLRLDLQNLRPLAERPAAMPMALALNLSAGIDGRKGHPGRLNFQGSLRLPPASGALTAQNGLRWQGRLNADHLPLHAFEPYVAQHLNLELLRADTSVRGNIDVGLPATGAQVGFRGDLAVEDFRANTLQPSEDLLNWKALNLRGIDLTWNASQPLRLTVAETVLSDYYARVLIDETGRINLQDLVRSPAGATAGQPVASTSPGPSAAAPADIRFGPVGLVNGRVAFADRFIRPNYSANLSDLSGSLGAFASSAAGSPPQMADLSLRGRVEGTATLDVSGKLNPLAKPLAMDVKGTVRELELPPLSPYTVKYAGHGIERGKLSMDVSYRIDPDGTLNASNQVILNQLRFGDRSADSDAPNLPVKLAVALLADRNGVIDINLPVSGSINDPQFRVGPIIVRLIFNLIGKAITSPFSLLASAFSGGGADLSQLAFTPGQRNLDADAANRLDAVAKALNDRPGLQLTVVGHSDLETERDGWRRARLNEWVQAEKRRQLARDGQPINAPVNVKAEEYPALLKEVYRRADIPKPRNIVGIAKDIPLPEMEALLLASIPVSADAMRELALARAVAVKDYLIEHQVPADRLFMNTAPCTAASAVPAAKPGEPATTACKPAVELRLEPR